MNNKSYSHLMYTFLIKSYHFSLISIAFSLVFSQCEKTKTQQEPQPRYVSIPDPNFRRYPQSRYILQDAFNTEAKLNVKHARVKKLIDLDTSSNSISNLTGIEYFPNLIWLYCYSNLL